MASTTKSLILRQSTSFPDRRFWGWPGVQPNNKQLNQLYTLGIWDLIKGRFKALETPINPANSNDFDGAYHFPMPPKMIEVLEPSATTIVPTQDGGKYVESQGSVFKDIRIMGTVGFRPNVPNTSEVSLGGAALGISLSVPQTIQNLAKDSRGLSPKEKTGFDEMVHLRNLFRRYFDLKGSSKDSSNTGMVWFYGKEAESWMVEPTNFSVIKESSNPMSWSYTIMLRTLYKLDAVFKKPKDVLDIFQYGANIFRHLRTLSRDIGRALRDVSGLVNFVAALPGNLVQRYFDLGLNIMRGFNALSTSFESFGDNVTRGVVDAWEATCREMDELMGDTVGVISGPDNPHDGGVGQTRNAIKSAWRQANKLLSMDPLWVSTKTKKVTDYAAAYLSVFSEAPQTTGSDLDVNSITLPSSTQQVSVGPNDTIRSLAKKHLGSEEGWKKLVIINNLKFPYISTASGDGVLGPNDLLLIPVGADDDEAQVPHQYNQDARYQAQDPLARKFGRDLKLEAIGGDANLGDVKVSQGGDLDFIDGQANVEQAIAIKFSTSTGELPVHPEFGAKFPIGRKVSLPTFQEFAIATRQTVFQDPRVLNIEKMNIGVDGDLIRTSATLRLRDTDTRLPISFSIRR